DLRLSGRALREDFGACRRHFTLRPHRFHIFERPVCHHACDKKARECSRKFLYQRQTYWCGRRTATFWGRKGLWHQRQGRIDDQPAAMGLTAHHQRDHGASNRLSLSVLRKRLILKKKIWAVAGLSLQVRPPATPSHCGLFALSLPLTAISKPLKYH